MRQPDTLTCALGDEAATTRSGAALAAALAAGPDGAFVTLEGELGAGKTTFVRGLLRALGVTGAVRSPTYTLLETYPALGGRVHHLDWYRLEGPDDLDGLGFRDLAGPGQWLLVEWPERIPAVAAGADLALTLAYAGTGRRLVARGLTPGGRALIGAWKTETA